MTDGSVAHRTPGQAQDAPSSACHDDTACRLMRRLPPPCAPPCYNPPMNPNATPDTAAALLPPHSPQPPPSPRPSPPCATASPTARPSSGVIGQGYVGLPLALVFCEAGFTVLGLDVDPVKVARSPGASPTSSTSGPSGWREAVAPAAGFTATTDFSRLAGCDAIIICVPTPLGRHREPDLSFIRDTADVVAAHLRPGQLVVLESTTYPGTTDEEVLPAPRAAACESPRDFLAGLLPRARGPGQPDVLHAHHPQGGGRRQPGVHRGGGRPLPRRRSTRWCRWRAPGWPRRPSCWRTSTAR